MAVVGMVVAIVARVGSVAVVAVIVSVIVVMVTESDGVVGYVVDDVVEGEHHRAKRHETDED